MFKITKEQQLKELIERIPPIVNVNLILHKDEKYLIGHRNTEHNNNVQDHWLFPGGRIKYYESPQQAVMRKLREELPGVKAILKKLVTVISDKGYDHRAYGIDIYYLLEYISGTPKPNEQLIDFKWQSLEELEQNDDLYTIEKELGTEIKQALKYINTNADELIVQVDEKDNVIGPIEKYKAHTDGSLFHRTALILVYNSKGEILLHQRSFLKNSGAGKWDIFGGHNNWGMTIEQTAKSELMEEVGIDTPLKFAFKYVYRGEKQSEYMYIYYTISDGPYAYDRNEVEQVKAFNVKDVIAGKYDKEFEILDHVPMFLKKFIDDKIIK